MCTGVHHSLSVPCLADMQIMICLTLKELPVEIMKDCVCEDSEPSGPHYSKRCCSVMTGLPLDFSYKSSPTSLYSSPRVFEHYD